MAAYPRCLRCAGAPRRPASGSGLSLPFRPDMPSSLTPGSSTIACVQCRDADAAFAEIRAARHSQHSRNPFHAGPGFRGFTGSRLLRPVRLLAPLDGSDRVSPATGGFYIQASGGSVALPAAGYDYNSNWTPLLAGLSPAGMAASLAAPDLTGFDRATAPLSKCGASTKENGLALTAPTDRATKLVTTIKSLTAREIVRRYPQTKKQTWGRRA